MPGELAHQVGAEGARRAKKWLDSTTRVTKSWTNEDQAHVNRLEFAWPFLGQNYSFDLGGMLSGGEYEGQFFLAEVKKYSVVGDQPQHWLDFVAKCYVTRRDHAALADQFIWITWHPFSQTDWPKLCTPEYVKKGLLTEKNRKRVFDTDEETAAAGLIEADLLTEVSDRMWLLVLNEKQERLVITSEHRALILTHQLMAES